GGDPGLDRRAWPAAVSIFRDTGLQAGFVLVGASIAEVRDAVGLRKEKTEADASCRIGGRGIEDLRAGNRRAEIDHVLEGSVGGLRVCRWRLHDAEERGVFLDQGLDV